MKRTLLAKIFLTVYLAGIFMIIAPAVSYAQPKPPVPPAKAEETVDLSKTVGSSMPLQIIVLLTVLSFIPALLISMTCFTRLIVVFHFLRQALGTQETPNNQVLLGL